jgi:hypothetical protein
MECDVHNIVRLSFSAAIAANARRENAKENEGRQRGRGRRRQERREIVRLLRIYF